MTGMRKTDLVIAVFLTVLTVLWFMGLTGCAQLKPQAEEEPVSAGARAVFVADIKSLLKTLILPEEGVTFIAKTDGGSFNRTLENSVIQELRLSGYAVSYLLPASERQDAGDESETVFGSRTAAVDYVAFSGTNYGEIAVEIDGERYARMFSVGANPAPVSNWVRRVEETDFD